MPPRTLKEENLGRIGLRLVRRWLHLGFGTSSSPKTTRCVSPIVSGATAPPGFQLEIGVKAQGSS